MDFHEMGRHPVDLSSNFYTADYDNRRVHNIDSINVCSY